MFYLSSIRFTGGTESRPALSDSPAANLQARHKGSQPIRLYQPVRIFCCKQCVHAICCMNYICITHGWIQSPTYDGLARIVDTPYTVCDGFFRTCNMNLDFSNGNVSSRAPVSVVIQICRTLKEVLRNFMYIRCCDTTKPPSPGISAWYRLYLLLSLLTCCGTIKPQLMSTCLYTFSGMYRVDHGCM